MSGAASSLQGCQVIVTAGGTREAIDPVRFLGNRSSGKMGNAVATEARRRGAVVTLITTVEDTAPADVEVVGVESALDMHTAITASLPGSTVLVMTAAVADYRPRTVASRKLKKREALTLDLVPTVDILRSIRDHPARASVLVVGFAAETDDLEENAARKLEEKGLDLIVLNDIGRSDIGMSSDDNEVILLGRAGLRVDVSRRPKREVAMALLDVVEQLLLTPASPPGGGPHRARRMPD